MSRNKDLLSAIGLRQDGRREHELRRIRCKLESNSEPDGSAYLEQGLTKVLAAVYGPHHTRGHRSRARRDGAVINCQISMAVFATSERKRVPRGDRKSTEMTNYLKQALGAAVRTELYPFTQIDVYVEVLHADGGVFPACVNAATLALIHAGVSMKEYVCACTATLANGDVPLVDVSHQEEMMGVPTLTMAALPISGKVVMMEMSGRFHLDHLPKVMDKALEGCRAVRATLDEEVKAYMAEFGSLSTYSVMGDGAN